MYIIIDYLGCYINFYNPYFPSVVTQNYKLASSWHVPIRYRILSTPFICYVEYVQLASPTRTPHLLILVTTLYSCLSPAIICYHPHSFLLSPVITVTRFHCNHLLYIYYLHSLLSSGPLISVFSVLPILFQCRKRYEKTF